MVKQKRNALTSLSVTKIVGLYVLFGTAWILFSDYALIYFTLPDVQSTQTIKRLLYVAATGAMLYYLLKQLVRQVKSANLQAKQSERRFREIFQQANDGIAIFAVDEQQQIRYVQSNVIFKRLTSYTDNELKQRAPIDYIISPTPQTAVPQLLQEGILLETIHIRNKQGKLIPVEVNSRSFPGNGRVEIVSIFRDISERKEAEEKIDFLATHDYLTDLPNPTVLLDEMRRYIAHQTELLFYVVQIERFKSLSTTVGLHESHAMLRQVAQRLERCIGINGMAARVSDDTFHVLVPGCGWELNAMYSRLLEEQFHLPIVSGEDEIVLGCRIGAACYPMDGQDENTMLRMAMYSLGMEKAHALSAEERQEIYLRRVLLEKDLPLALHKEQFSLRFQPKIALTSGRLAGVEALLRWQHPTLGPVSPVDFIPVAEETGAILPIGNWVLLEACRQVQTLRDTDGNSVSVAVNISIRQFMQRNFVAIVKQALLETGLEPSRLILEITESLAMNVEETLPILQELKQHGVQISIDDFGTGYCSFAYLKHLPLDELKIDRSFIEEIHVQAHDRSLVHTISYLAKSMQIRVVAEGISKAEQLSCLQELPCDLGQGYYFSEPLTWTELEAFIAAPGLANSFKVRNSPW